MLLHNINGQNKHVWSETQYRPLESTTRATFPRAVCIWHAIPTQECNNRLQSPLEVIECSYLLRELSRREIVFQVDPSRR